MLSRTAIRRALPAPTAATRCGALSVSHRWSSSFSEGSVAQSKEFGRKEKAHEDMYIREHEKQVLTKLRNEIEKKKNELAALEKEHDEKLVEHTK